MKGGNVVSVIGRGASPEYSGALVDAVMEAYVISVRPAEGETGTGLGSEIDRAEKGLQEAERAWTSFRLEHDISRLDSDLSAAERRQKRLGVAEDFYQRELDWVAKLTLEQDITRRQASAALPPEMPAELAALARTTLTVGEVAYLSALKGANAPAIEAARKEAEKDREDRARSMRKQMEIGRDLARAAAAEIARLRALQKESESLQARHRAAGAAYADVKSREKNMGNHLNDSVHPVVSITERASKVKRG
jgi:predicted  nucleic acid-binding Zn-ribbon protein